MKISVTAHPKAKKVRVIEKSPGHYDVWVREVPDQGKANTAIIEVLSEHFGVSKSKVQILKGFSGKRKVIEVAAI